MWPTHPQPRRHRRGAGDAPGRHDPRSAGLSIRESGIYFDPGSTEFPSIPARPTRRDAVAASALLIDIIEGFPFVDEASRSVALALLITPLIRYAVRSRAANRRSARPKMGSGKTLLSHLPAYIRDRPFASADGASR